MCSQQTGEDGRDSVSWFNERNEGKAALLGPACSGASESLRGTQSMSQCTQPVKGLYTPHSVIFFIFTTFSVYRINVNQLNIFDILDTFRHH